MRARSDQLPGDLLTIELRRLARRTGLELAADRMLATVQLGPVSNIAIERASRLDPLELRTLDSIHLDAALQLTAPRDHEHPRP